MCSTWQWGSNAGSAAASAWLMLRAPRLPPKTSSTGMSASRPSRLAGFVALPGQGQDLLAHRIAGDDGLAGKPAGHLREGHAHAAGEAAHAPDGQARLDIGQVDEDGHAGPPGCQHYRPGHEAAGDEDHVRPELGPAAGLPGARRGRP